MPAYVKTTVSHHLLVEKTKRGPWRWRVVAVDSDAVRVNPIVVGDDGRPSVERYRFGGSSS